VRGDHDCHGKYSVVCALRTRLVGLAALTSVVTSEALYHSIPQLKVQASIFMASLVVPLLEVEVSSLNRE
jgi:protein EFR3